MLVITGATGNIGSTLAELLLAGGRKVRVIGRSRERLAGLEKKGAEPAAGDLGDPDFLARAFTGAEAVFAMIPPNHAAEDFRAYQRRISESIVTAVGKSGVRYVVDLSSQGAHLPAGTGPIAGLHDHEERLNRTEGVNVLHLRPTYFMENLLTNIGLIRKAGIMGSAVRGDVRFAMIATKDIAHHAAERMAARDFAGRTVRDLLGPRDVSLDEAAAVIGAKLGMPGLRYVAFPYDEAEKGMAGSPSASGGRRRTRRPPRSSSSRNSSRRSITHPPRSSRRPPDAAPPGRARGRKFGSLPRFDRRAGFFV
jgi:uncharacterized protein YbjT (DUF2867 family)